MYIPAIVAVAEHFSKRQSMAMGICVCGTGVGTFLLAPAELMLLDAYGWRWTLRAMAALVLVCILSGLVMSPPAPSPAPSINSINRRRRSTVVSMHGSIVEDMTVSHNTNLGNSTASPMSCSKSLISLFLSKDLLESPALSTYLLIALADGVATLALFIPFTYLPDLAVSKGVSANDAAFLISAAGTHMIHKQDFFHNHNFIFSGISSSAGRLLSGVLCDLSWFHPLILTTVVVCFAAVPALAMSWVTCYSAFLTLSCMFGVFTGLWIAATSPLLVRFCIHNTNVELHCNELSFRILGLPLLPSAFGLMTAFQGTSALLGPPLAGFLVEWRQSPAVSLYSTGGLLLGATIVFIIASIHNRRKEKRRQYIQF